MYVGIRHLLYIPIVTEMNIKKKSLVIPRFSLWADFKMSPFKYVDVKVVATIIAPNNNLNHAVTFMLASNVFNVSANRSYTVRDLDDT